jgi:hypothetical protein
MAMVLMGETVSGKHLRKEQEIPTNTTVVASPSINETQPILSQPPVETEPQNPSETPFIIPEDPSVSETQPPFIGEPQTPDETPFVIPEDPSNGGGGGR